MMKGEVFMIRTLALVTLVVAFLACGFGEENSRAWGKASGDAEAKCFRRRNISLPDIFIPGN